MSLKRNTRASHSVSSSTTRVPLQAKDQGSMLLQLSSLNPYITCPICEGYFVEATTVIDCLHTFCKSCLLKHFEDNNDCPKCNLHIHQSHPTHYVAFDRTMQDIVYKLVPGMQAEEMRRRETFYKQLYKPEQIENGVHSDFQPTDNLVAENSASTSNGPESYYKMKECCNVQQPSLFHHRSDQGLIIHLVPEGKLGNVKRPFVRLSEFATVNTVKRLLAYLLFNDITRYNEFDLFCNNELMGRDYSMAFISKTRWRNRISEPLMLIYKEHVDF